MKMWETLLALIVLASPISAAEMDKATLRQLANVPEPGNFVLGIGFSSSKGFVFAGEKTDPPSVTIARIRKELKGDATDAERYQRLWSVYEKSKRKKDADDAKVRAIALLRQQVKDHPHDMYHLAQLGDFLFFSGETKEGEESLRRAVKETPHDWRVWKLLADCIDNQATSAILGHQKYSYRFSDAEVMHPAILDEIPDAEKIAKWRKLRQEALRCYDQAIKLAPQEREPHFWRAGSLFLQGIIEVGLRNGQGEQVPMWNAFLTPAFAAETRQIARLSPNDPKSVCGAVIVELGMGIAKDKTKPGDPIVPLDCKLPQASRDFVHWGKHRLEEMTKSAEKNTAAAASECLALVLTTEIMGDGLTMSKRFNNEQTAEDSTPGIKDGLCAIALGLKVLSNVGQIEKNFRRAVQLDPTREFSWDTLTLLLYAFGRIAEAVPLCEQRIRIKDNAHNRLSLAYGYFQQREYDKAAEQLRSGLKSDNNNLDCRFGLIAVLLQSEDAEALKQAAEQLDALAARLKKVKKKSRTAQYQLLRGLHAALSDRREWAKELFQGILRQDTDNRSAVEALIALGIPATPGDALLAISYLKAHEAEIQRADKRSDSPVEKIRLSENNISDEDLYFLSAFPQLHELQLSKCSIANEGLAYLEHLTSLRRLELDCAEITDAGLTHLHSLKRLKFVNLRGTKVTEKGIAQLRKALPKLDISR